EHGREATPVRLGARAGSGALPLSGDAYREAIRAKGVQVDANLRGFEAGLAVAARAAGAARGGEGSPSPPPTAPATQSATSSDMERITAGFRAELRPVLRQAIARLIDYQDRAHAEPYPERLRPVVCAGNLALRRVAARQPL